MILILLFLMDFFISVFLPFKQFHACTAAGFDKQFDLGGLGCKAEFSAEVLEDNALIEKAWQDRGMLAEGVFWTYIYIYIYICI